MATNFLRNLPTQILILVLFVNSVCSAARILADSNSDDESMEFKYHNGRLLSGEISVNLIWYGKFKPSQKAIIADFVSSCSSPESRRKNPSVAAWWDSAENLYHKSIKSQKPSSIQLVLGDQILDENYSLGKSLKMNQIEQLAASKGGSPKTNAINVVLTSNDVVVEGFCSSKCGTHGSFLPKTALQKMRNAETKIPYIWVGNPETQCPGLCAWPFHQPVYGPQSEPLIAPNGDVGLDGMVINLASLLAGTVTNPFGTGFYQGPAGAPLEAASACPGVYGSGAYPGYAGALLVDPVTGTSYNSYGVNGRKYLVPALYNPKTKSCSTLV